MPRSESQQCHPRPPTTEIHFAPGNMSDLAPELQPPGWALMKHPKASYLELKASSGQLFKQKLYFQQPTFTWHSKANKYQTKSPVCHPHRARAGECPCGEGKKPRLDLCPLPLELSPCSEPYPWAWLSVQRWAHFSRHSLATRLALPAALQTRPICRNPGF